MAKNERAEVERIDPTVDGRQTKIRNNQQGRDPEDDRRNGEGREALEHPLLSDYKCGAEPQPKDQTDDESGSHGDE